MLNLKDKTKDVGWLIPGLNVKRWLFLIFLGSVMILLGFMIILDIRPIYLTMELIRQAALVLPSNALAIAFIIIGSFIFFSGWKKTTNKETQKMSEKYNQTVLA